VARTTTGNGFEGRVEVRGLTKLTRALRKAGVEIKDMKAANARVGDIVVQAARPVTPHRTGALANSIRPAQRQSGVIVRAGGVRGVRYAKYVEYGTKKMAARSYLVKTVNDTQPRWMDEYAEELQRLMDKAANSSDGTGE
jgi:HK97 gp10 family phage protein